MKLKEKVISRQALCGKLGKVTPERCPLSELNSWFCFSRICSEDPPSHSQFIRRAEAKDKDGQIQSIPIKVQNLTQLNREITR